MSLNTQGTKDFADYQFLIRFAEEFAALSTEDQKALVHRDYPNSGGSIRLPAGVTPLTTECRRRLLGVARRAIRALGGVERARHSASRVAKELKVALEAYLDAGSLSEDNAHLIVNECIGAMRSRYQSLTHFVPCVLFVGSSNPGRVQIGPVEFMPMRVFLNDYQEKIQTGVKGRFGAEADMGMWPRISRFLAPFDWIAAVCVPECDAERSEELARSTVQLAIDALKTGAGRREAKDLRPAYVSQNETDYASLSQSADGDFRIGIGSIARGLVYDRKWYQELSESPGWAATGEVLDRFLSALGQVDELDSRLLDAIHWHSDAASEINLPAALTKFWFAIERLTVCDTNKGASVRRVSRIVYGSAQNKDVQRLKSLRDKVTHGNAGPLNATIQESDVLKTERISRAVLFHYLDATASIRNLAGSTEKERFAVWLRNMD